MLNFKESATKDLDTFINSIEFGESHQINGQAINIILDNFQLMQRSKVEYDGISVGEILYCVKASDYGPIPKQGEQQIFDGRLMYVFDAREDDGLYEIILRQNRGD
jgi:hypothetical protein